MSFKQSILLCLFIIISNSGCTSNETKDIKYQACTNDWLLQVENDILTGDGQGHGPDIGSLEWRSVIEFKLGIRNDPKVPPKESEQWCNYINENFINTEI